MIEYCGNDDIRIDQADVLIKSSGRCEESRPVHDILFIEPLLFFVGSVIAVDLAILMRVANRQTGA